jgi:outer membrane protein assembly factor BamE (lipoprotein component of BamABCDE complex)
MAADVAGKKLLKRGMSKEQVKTVFGEPDYVDTRSERVEMWDYGLSLSGTVGYWLVFLNGKLDFFGLANTSGLREKYFNK